MKNKLLFMIPVSAVVGIVLLSNTNKEIEKYHKDGIENINFSSNPPTAKTGAPGEGNCTNCHSGTTQSAAGSVDFSYSDVNNEYIVGQTYTFSLGIPSNTNNGFEMTILDGSNNKAGLFTTGTNSSKMGSGGKEYIRQSAKTTDWTFSWTAPSSDVGSLTAYYAVAKGDGFGGNSGDVIYLGQYIISSAQSNEISEYEKQDKKINIYFDENNKELNVKFNLSKKSNIQINVSNLSGKLVETIDLDQKSFGPHSEKIQLQNVKTEGIYFVSLFVNNYVYNRKIHLK